MAIRKCRECGKPVSSKARNCPNCGVKIRRSFGLATLGCFTFLVLAFCGGMLGFVAGISNDMNPALDQARTENLDSRSIAETEKKKDTAEIEDEPIPETIEQEETIPGLTAVDVHGNFTNKGFKLTTEHRPAFSFEGGSYPEETVWSCTEETSAHQTLVEVFGASPTQITSVSVTYSNYSRGSTNQGCKDVFGNVASIHYHGSQPKIARVWVKKNIGKNAKRTIGGVNFELFANAPRSRMLVIQPVTGKERMNVEIETDPEIRASKKLKLAKLLLKKKESAGKRWLQEIIDEFPGTAAAKEAEELLE